MGEEVDPAPTVLDPEEVAGRYVATGRGKDGRFVRGWKGGGRRSKYTPAIGRAICKMLAGGMTLNQICKRRVMPSERTVRTWAMDIHHPFSPMYIRARELGYFRMADEIVDISDDGTNDWVERENKDGSTYTAIDHEHVTRSRLRVDTRKWLLSKALPKIYGDKVTTEVTGADGGPLKFESSDEIEQARRVAFALGRALERSRLKVIDAAG